MRPAERLLSAHEAAEAKLRANLRKLAALGAIATSVVLFGCSQPTAKPESSPTPVTSTAPSPTPTIISGEFVGMQVVCQRGVLVDETPQVTKNGTTGVAIACEDKNGNILSPPTAIRSNKIIITGGVDGAVLASCPTDDPRTPEIAAEPIHVGNDTGTLIVASGCSPGNAPQITLGGIERQ